jgi:formylglycine-generating enzyme required for sulfatase activity
VNDYYFAGYYAASPATNPQGPAAGGVRVIRGGSWNSATFNFRTSTRASNIPTTQNDEIGFRCAK